jgi:hypothetical protein
MRGLLGLLGILALTACGGQTGPLPSVVATPSVSITPTPTGNPSLIAIGSPATGAAGPVPVLIAGTVATAAGTVTVEAQSEDGTVLCRRTLEAGAGAAGALRDWSATLAFVPPKPATAYAETPVVVRAWETGSPEEARTNLAERTIRVSADLPPIVIISPGCGQSVTKGSSLTVTGRTLAIETSFRLHLQGADGQVAAEQAVTSGSVSTGSGDTAGAEWSTTLTLPAELASGDYDLVAASVGEDETNATAPPQAASAPEFAIQVRVN